MEHISRIEYGKLLDITCQAKQKHEETPKYCLKF